MCVCRGPRFRDLPAIHITEKERERDREQDEVPLPRANSIKSAGRAAAAGRSPNRSAFFFLLLPQHSTQGRAPSILLGPTVKGSVVVCASLAS